LKIWRKTEAWHKGGRINMAKSMAKPEKKTKTEKDRLRCGRNGKLGGKMMGGTDVKRSLDEGVG